MIIIPPDRQISDDELWQNEHGQLPILNLKAPKECSRCHRVCNINIKSFQNPGENGIAVFTGATIVGNNKTRMVNIVIDNPPEITSFRYRFKFELTQLEDMLVDKKSYGLFVIDS